VSQVRVAARLSGLLSLLLTVALLGATGARAAQASLKVENPPKAGKTGGPVPTVVWTTGNGAPGEVLVMTSDGVRRLFAAGPSGSQAAPFVQAGVPFTFQLFQTAPKRQLVATVKLGPGKAVLQDIKPALATPAATGGLANALLLILPFVALIGIAWLAVAVVLEARRGA
jgi:hypothetical protein